MRLCRSPASTTSACRLFRPLVPAAVSGRRSSGWRASSPLGVRLVLACKHCSHLPGVCLCRSLPRNFRNLVNSSLACASVVAVRLWSTAAIAASARGQCQYCQTVSVIYRFIDCAEVNTVRSNARGLSAPGACVVLLLRSPWPRLGTVDVCAPTTPQHAALRLLAESLFPSSHAMHHEILNSNGSIVVCARTRCNKAGATK